MEIENRLDYIRSFFASKRVSEEGLLSVSEEDEREAHSKLKQEIEEHHRYLLSSEIDVIQTITTTVDVKSTEFVHAPVWFLRYEYRGKQYQLLFDGASGDTIKGDIPPPDDTSTKGFFGKMGKSFFGK